MMMIILLNIVAQIWRGPVTQSWSNQFRPRRPRGLLSCAGSTHKIQILMIQIFLSNVNLSQREIRAQVNVAPEGHGCAPTYENNSVGLNSPHDCLFACCAFLLQEHCSIHISLKGIAAHFTFFSPLIWHFVVQFFCLFVRCMPCPAWERSSDICNEWRLQGRIP